MPQYISQRSNKLKKPSLPLGPAAPTLKAVAVPTYIIKLQKVIYYRFFFFFLNVHSLSYFILFHKIRYYRYQACFTTTVLKLSTLLFGTKCPYK